MSELKPTFRKFQTMRLGVAYNFFNAEEHLLASLRSVRNAVDFIVIIYQTVSNAGDIWTDEAHTALEAAVSSNLADMAIEYTPDAGLSRQENELKKRKLGLAQCRTARCSHFLSMDADEFYRHSELEESKSIILRDCLTRTTVSSLFHLQRPVYRSLDTTNVAFICRLDWLTRIGVPKYPAPMVDPTRKVGTFPGRHTHFGSETVAMYHMNFVRKNFASKLRNTSTTDQIFLNLVESRIDEWTYPHKFDFPNKGNFEMTLVENEFATFDPAES
jgi:hypothetical protein